MARGFIIDHPHVRRSASCPGCGETKGGGLVVCWGCHHVMQTGTKDVREIYESAIDCEELELEQADDKRMAIFAGVTVEEYREGQHEFLGSV